MEKDYLYEFLEDTLPDCPDIMYGPCKNEHMVCVVMPQKEDVLVLMALALMLFRLSHGGLPKEGYRLENLNETFSNSLKRMGKGKVDRVYRLDLQASLKTIPISLVLDKIKHLVGDGSVYKLISSFLNLPIIDDDGNHRSDISCGGIPPVGEITKVLFNIMLRDTFDREFPKRFPGIKFYRFINEVFISTNRNDKVIFDEKAGYALLEELSLAGKFSSVEAGDEPISCYYYKLLNLSSDGKVFLIDRKDYY